MAESSEAWQIAELKAQLAAAEAEIALLRRQQGLKQDTGIDPMQLPDKPVQPSTSGLRKETKASSSKSEPSQAAEKQIHGREKCAPASESKNQDVLKCATDRYKKTGGAADGVGNDYEHKMLTLVYLRMLVAAHEFQLASNMEAAGKFDDIVMRYRKLYSEDWNMCFVQLKHKLKKNKLISILELLGLSGDFSLIGYCHSYKTMELSKELHSFGNFNDHEIIIFTNASIADGLVYEVEADPLLDTKGKAVSFKAGGKVFQELCEWVDIKEALTELHGQVEGSSEEEVKRKVKDAVQNMNFMSRAVTSFKGELLKTPTLLKLETLLTKLELVNDKDTYSSFLAKLKVYINQAQERKIDANIKKEVGKVWKYSADLEAEAMFHVLQDKVKSWWQKHNFYLTQDSPLWLDIIKSQTETLSKSTVEKVIRIGIEFEKNCLQELENKFNEICSTGGILNLRVDWRTAASSLRVHQTLANFRPNENVLHVNVKALLEREDDVLAAWATRWCRLLVVECDAELEQSQAERIGEKIVKVIGCQYENKLLVLIAPETHSLNIAMKGKTSELNVNDSAKWADLTQATQEAILQTEVNIQGAAITLSDFEKKEKEYHNIVLENKRRFRDCLVEHFDLEIFSQLLKGDTNCGKTLENVGRIFVPRHLKRSNYGKTFLVNSVTEKVVLLVAEPGMGKSTLMTHLANSAKKEDPTAWIVHIKLNDCTAYLDSIDKEKLNAERTWEFLEHCALSQGNKLEEFIFRYLKHKLILFVDGVDEVNPHYEGQIFTLFSFLKGFNFTQLWVSSRPTFKSKLEKFLGVNAIGIAKFSVMEQTEFFNKTWKKQDKSVSDNKCTEKTESLLKLFGNSLDKDDPILGVPLITNMIAEVYNSSTDKFVRNGRLEKTSLVETYVDRRFEILCNEKMKMENRHLSGSKDNEKNMQERIHSNHCLAALRVMFSPEEIKTLQFKGKEDFDKDLTSYLQDVSEGREKTGIIDNVIKDVPHFTHRLFAEYFAAMWLASNFKTNPDFTNKLIFHPAYKALAEMFNHILAEKHPLHEAVLHEEVKDLECLLKTRSDVNDLDDGGRTALHLAVLLSGTDLTIVKLLVEKYKARVDIADSIAGWTPLQYAEQARAWDPLEFFLKNGNKTMEGWPRPDPAVMLDAASDASVFVVRYLVEERVGELNCRGTDGETMIHRAAEGGNIEMLEYLVTKGLSLDTKDKGLNTTLHYATHHDHVPTVSFLLERGVDLEAVNSQGLTTFQEAAQHGSYEVMAILHELKKFNFSSTAKASPVQMNLSLLCAAFAGSLEFVERLVKMGARVGHQDNKGHTAAWVAMHRKHSQVMDWLLLRGSRDGDTHLHGACEKLELEIVTFILSQGYDIEAKGAEGRTPLIAAAMNNRLAVMELLLENGANVDGSDAHGHTSLHKASQRRYKQAVELLLRHGARVDNADHRGETSLHYAISFNKLDVVKLLLDNEDRWPGGKLTQVGRSGVTSLVAASIKGDLDGVINMLETFNAEREGMSKDDFINMKDMAGWTVLHYVARLGQSEIIPYLISEGGDQRIRDRNDNTPLGLAASLKHPGTVRALIAALNEVDRAAMVNSRDKYGYSILMWGAWGGCLKCVDVLVEAGGKMTQTDKKGWTSLTQAAVWNHVSVVSFLLRTFDPKSEGMLLKDFINMKDRGGKTALVRAEPECRKVIESCLAQV